MHRVDILHVNVICLPQKNFLSLCTLSPEKSLSISLTKKIPLLNACSAQPGDARKHS